MADEVSAEIIQSTQKLLGKHVTKPQLTEKLLRKPPFRFLHDIITLLVRNGFLKGLYNDSELNFENVKEREAKISFLNKLITAVKAISGKDLKVKSSKIIAGLDATETNRLLQTIAKLIDDKVDTREYVKSLKKTSSDPKKEVKGRDSVDKKSSSKITVGKAGDKIESTRKKVEKKPSRKGSDDGTPKELKGKVPVASKSKTETPKGRTKTEKGSTKITDTKEIKADNTKGSVSKLSPKNKTSPKVETLGVESSTQEVEVPNEVEDVKEEGTEKPQDDVKDDVKESTGDHENGSPRDDSWKPQILKDNPELEDRPPSYNATKKLDEIQSSLMSKTGGTTPEEPVPMRQPSARPKSARPRSGNNDRVPSGRPNKAEEEIEVKPEEPSQQNIPRKPEIKPMMAIRDLSALKNRETSSPKNSNSVEQEIEEVKKAAPFRPKSSLLRPPSVRPSSARPAAPRLRPESSLPLKEVVPLGKINVIVENFDTKDTAVEEDEEETVVIQSVPDEQAPENNFTEKSLNLDIPADKGHLVEQILEQIQDGGQGEKAQLEWEHEGSKGKDATTKEITALRGSIQALTKTANPLGKLASYLHEDVEAMHTELETWLKMKQQCTDEIVKQRRVNTESNQPLLQQLHNLEDNIKHEREEIATIKYNILRNEERIRHMVTKQIVID